MVLPSSGLPISFSEMRDEFGPTQIDNSLSIGSYRISDDIGTLTDLPLDDGVPQSGTIKSSDLYSKRLNVVIDLFSGSSVVRQDSRAIYDNARSTPTQQIIPVGGFKEPEQVPASGTGSKIITNVNKQIGSATGNRNNVALKTGQWGSNAIFDLVIGPSGGIYGAGGDGGSGGGPGNGANGGDGSSGLGIQYPTTIISQGGVIVAGGGGGGGGGVGGGYEYNNVQDCDADLPGQPRAGGGGGGGGRGFPGGSGGAGNNYSLKRNGGSVTVSAQNGQPGTINSNGAGGAGSVNIPNDQGCGAQAGIGGAGGSAPNAGGNGSVYLITSPGQGGASGYAIIKSVDNYILGDVPPVSGDIVTSTVL